MPRREGAQYRLPFRELFDASNLNVDGEITQDEAAIQYRKGDRLWHTDSAFMEKRTSYSLLLAHSVPPEGGETSFADTRSAYEDLPQEMKDFLEGKVGINSLWWSRKMAGADIPTRPRSTSARRPATRWSTSTRARAARRCSSPRTRWTSKACPRKKAAQLIRDLIEHCTQPQYVFSVDWHVGDMVIWDNLCSMHRGGEYDYGKYKRDMRRTTVREGTEPHQMETGDDPFGELFARTPEDRRHPGARVAGR